MAPTCEPLCCFDERLYFTTFPHPAPDPQLLNLDSTERPKVRVRNHHGARPVPPDTGAPYYYFTVDDQLVYLSFFQDWGPLNLAMVYKACILFHELLQDEELAGHRLVLYSSDDPRRKANAALLLALYVMIVQRRPPWEAFHPIAELEFMPFRDAGRGPSDFNLSIQDCLWGIWKAMQNGLCDMNEFSVEEYEYYEKVENGDWNWITPNFIAFASPVDVNWIKQEKERKAQEQEDDENKSGSEKVPDGSASPARSKRPSVTALQRKLPQSFQNCLDYFEKRNIKLVVRLNTELYDRKTFIDRGIDHVEMYFDDGTNPTDEITRNFIDMADKVITAGGAVAVHCKAGLGRTGTLIGAYMIWKYGFTANEAIAFMRIVRPGSVVGPQQHYMYLKQLEWNKWSAADEVRREQARAAASAAAATPIVTPATPPADTDSDEVDVRMDLAEAVIPIIMPSTPPPHLPPVTPSRHVAAAQAKAKAITPPGQPRKTPMAKRVAVDPSDDEAGPGTDGDADGDESVDMLPALGIAPLASSSRMGAAKAKAKTKPPMRPTAGGKTASERPARMTRSALGGAIKKGPLPASPTKPALVTSVSNPNKIPRLAGSGSGATTRSAAKAAAAASGLPAAPTPGPTSRRVPPPTPSRLPQLIPTQRRHHATASMSTGASAAAKALTESTKLAPGSDAWMSQGKDAVVVPASKKERPGLRPIRRRRSSFSSADVVA